MTVLIRTADNLEALMEIDREHEEIIRLMRPRIASLKDPPIPKPGDTSRNTRRYRWTSEKKDHLRVYEEAI